MDWMYNHAYVDSYLLIITSTKKPIQWRKKVATSISESGTIVFYLIKERGQFHTLNRYNRKRLSRFLKSMFNKSINPILIHFLQTIWETKDNLCCQVTVGAVCVMGVAFQMQSWFHMLKLLSQCPKSTFSLLKLSIISQQSLFCFLSDN